MGNKSCKVIKQGVKPITSSQIHLGKNNTFNSSDEKSTEPNDRTITSDSVSKIVEDPPFNNDEESYNMSHPKRGLAVIFNHKIFAPKLGLAERKGTDIDKENLLAVLEELGFNAQVHEDLTYKEFEGVLENISSRMDHSESDCILIVVLTHGEEGILNSNDHPYKTTKIWDSFTDGQCPSLAGKPKMFFIQACRGENMDHGVTLTSRTEHDSIPISCNIPNHPDYLVVYSTIEGFYSWRNTTMGSWFIRSLCHHLSECNQTGKDILSGMTATSRTVAMYFQSSSYNPSMNNMKQVPCVYSTLTKDVILTVK
jgi:caspase-like apoptosis-related cysteine protease